MERRKSNKLVKFLVGVTVCSSIVIIALMIQTVTKQINFFMSAVLSFFFLLVIATTNLIIKLISKRKTEREGIPLAIFANFVILVVFIISVIMFYNYL